MQAKEQYSGRRMKCPSCQNVLTIPTPAGTDAPAEPAPVLLPPTPPESENEVPTMAAELAPRSTRLPEIADPWKDRSLEQRPTPWQGDDAKRYGGETQEGVRSSGRWTKLLLVALFLGGIAAGWYYWPEVTEYVRAKAAQQKTKGVGSQL